VSTVIFEPYTTTTPAEGNVPLPLLQCFGFAIPLSPGAVQCYGLGKLPRITAAGTADVYVEASATVDLPLIQPFGMTSATAVGHAELPRLEVAGYVGSTATIDVTAGYVPLPPIECAGTATPRVSVSGAVGMPALQAFGVVDDAIVGMGSLPFLGAHGVMASPQPTAWATLYQSQGWLWADAFEESAMSVSLTEYLNASTTTQSSFLIALRERLGIVNTPASILSTAIELEDTLAIRDVLQYALDVVMAEVLHLGDDVAATRRVLAQITERLVLTGTATSTLDAQVTLATALVLGDEVAAPFLAALTETLDLGATLDVQIARVVALLEELQLADAATAGLTVVANVDETLLLADAGDTQLSANVLLREALECFGTLSINGDVWSCWLINTESKGVARYTNYPFNSFAKAPWGAYVGATDTGLYELGGDTDDGEPITARIRSALTDFGDRRAKRVPAMYVGYTATGQIGLKVISTSERGVKTEDHYLLEPRPATGGVRESRFKVGRGIASVYLGFEVVNVGGADFALDVVEWLPIRLDRRVR